MEVDRRIARLAVFLVLLLKVCQLVDITLGSALQREEPRASKKVDSLDGVEKDLLRGLSTAPDHLSGSSRERRDTFLMESSLFVDDNDGEEEESENDENDKLTKNNDEKKTQALDKEPDVDNKEEERKKDEQISINEPEKDYEEKVGREKDEQVSLKKPEKQPSAEASSKEKQQNELEDYLYQRHSLFMDDERVGPTLSGFIEQNREFLLAHLDSENFYHYLKLAFYSYVKEEFRDVSEQVYPDKRAKRTAFLEFWAAQEAPEKGTGYLLLCLFKQFRPGLFQEPSWTYADDHDMIRLPVAPPNGRESTSCRSHVLHDILDHKNLFIKNVENSSRIEEFFSPLTRTFDNQVDNTFRRSNLDQMLRHMSGGFVFKDWTELMIGFWLHCLDYESEEKKFEFITLLREEQPGIFSEQPLSDLLTQLDSVEPTRLCVPEESQFTPSNTAAGSSGYEQLANELTLWAAVGYGSAYPRKVRKYSLNIVWCLGPPRRGMERNYVKITSVPFFVGSHYLSHYSTQPVMLDKNGEPTNATNHFRKEMVGGLKFNYRPEGIIPQDEDLKSGTITITIKNRLDEKHVATLYFEDNGNNVTTARLSLEEFRGTKRYKSTFVPGVAVVTKFKEE